MGRGLVFVRGLLSTSLRELGPVCNSAAARLCSCSIDVAVAARLQATRWEGSNEQPIIIGGNSEKAKLVSLGALLYP
jgi:hypothetical protein